MAEDTLYPRLAERRLKEALEDSPVVLIQDPRQCGKTTLAHRSQPGHARSARHRQAPAPCAARPTAPMPPARRLFGFNDLGKIFAACGRVVGMLGHSWPVVNELPSVPSNSLTPTVPSIQPDPAGK